MKTVEKALGLLSCFSIDAPEHGLSDIARWAGTDKATALRLLTALKVHGFVEQDASSKRYRLGGALLKFARIREASFPVVSVMQPALDHLADLTGETAHGSLLVGMQLVTVAIAEPQRSTRVHINAAETLPFHATASGLVFLAFAPAELTARLVDPAKLERFTVSTPQDAASLRPLVEAATRRGYAVSPSTYEAEVIGVAMPIFDWSATVVGTVAVASLSSRWGRENEISIAKELSLAAAEVTRGMGGKPQANWIVRLD